MDNLCVICGEILPEGLQVCQRCMGEAKNVKPSEVQELMMVYNIIDKVEPRNVLIEAAKVCLQGVIERMGKNEQKYR